MQDEVNQEKMDSWKQSKCTGLEDSAAAERQSNQRQWTAVVRRVVDTSSKDDVRHDMTSFRQ